MVSWFINGIEYGRMMVNEMMFFFKLVSNLMISQINEVYVFYLYQPARINTHEPSEAFLHQCHVVLDIILIHHKLGQWIAEQY